MHDILSYIHILRYILSYIHILRYTDLVDQVDRDLTLGLYAILIHC